MGTRTDVCAGAPHWISQVFKLSEGIEEEGDDDKDLMDMYV